MAHVKQTKLKMILQYNGFFLIMVLYNNRVTCGQHAHVQLSKSAVNYDNKVCYVDVVY